MTRAEHAAGPASPASMLATLVVLKVLMAGVALALTPYWLVRSLKRALKRERASERRGRS